MHIVMHTQLQFYIVRVLNIYLESPFATEKRLMYTFLLIYELQTVFFHVPESYKTKIHLLPIDKTF